MAPKVSIGMPVYNGENFIEKCITSVLGQTFRDLELIICDNASEDRTQVICRRFAEQDPRVKYIRNEKNLGAAPNYNRCLENASGEYFKWIAHDDWLSENYIETCVKALDVNPDAVMAFGIPRDMLDDDTEFYDAHYAIDLWGLQGPVERFGEAVRISRPDHAIFGLYRRDGLLKSTWHRPYYGSDRALVAEMAIQGRFIAVPEALFFNRHHAERSVTIADRIQRMKWQDTSLDRKYAMEQIDLMKHLVEITGRYPEIAARPKLFMAMFGRMFGLRQLLRYGSEVFGMMFPSLHQRLHKSRKVLG